MPTVLFIKNVKVNHSHFFLFTNSVPPIGSNFLLTISNCINVQLEPENKIGTIHHLSFEVVVACVCVCSAVTSQSCFSSSAVVDFYLFLTAAAATAKSNQKTCKLSLQIKFAFCVQWFRSSCWHQCGYLASLYSSPSSSSSSSQSLFVRHCVYSFAVAFSLANEHIEAHREKQNWLRMTGWSLPGERQKLTLCVCVCLGFIWLARACSWQRQRQRRRRRRQWVTSVTALFFASASIYQRKTKKIFISPFARSFKLIRFQRRSRQRQRSSFSLVASVVVSFFFCRFVIWHMQGERKREKEGGECEQIKRANCNKWNDCALRSADQPFLLLLLYGVKTVMGSSRVTLRVRCQFLLFSCFQAEATDLNIFLIVLVWMFWQLKERRTETGGKGIHFLFFALVLFAFCLPLPPFLLFPSFFQVESHLV